MSTHVSSPALRRSGVSNTFETLPAASPKRLLRLPEVMTRVGLKRSTIYKRMSEGTFPKSRSLGPKCAVWIEAEIDEWIGGVAEGSGFRLDGRS